MAGSSPVEVSSASLPLEQIHDRVGGDTRPLNPAHIEELAKSIALLGLIEPLVIDNQNRLLAGGHRRAAILQVWENEPEIFERHFTNGIPVYQIDIDSEKDPELAVKIEIAENEHRRDYTPGEVRAIADRFRNAGLSGERGRPAKGEQPLIPALMSVIGKSRTTVWRYLAAESDKNISSETISKPDYDRKLRLARKNLSDWLKKPRKTSREKETAIKVTETLKAINELLNDP